MTKLGGERGIFVIIAVLVVVCLVAEVGYCRTIKVRADGTGDYPTIQAAINAANPGDEVVLERGTYAGPGNRNLDFKGKAITVRSREPDNNACMCETIIDANGQGVIVRFVSDEGSESIFAGFTLLGGNTSMPVRGIAGFFEFSDNAKPILRRLRVGGDITPLAPLTEHQIPRIGTLASDLPYGGRLWDGNNPFHQPAVTTNYYGSGDVDNDGNLTSADVSLAQDMADGAVPPVTRADVDGDENVDNDDVSLISSTLSGGTLDGWWNSLAGRTERDAWVTKFMAIDQTNSHPYQWWFVCGPFAAQTHIHGAFYRGELYSTYYDGGQTVFNVPLYDVSIIATGFGHGINAILVGDDPLNFDDWRFIEPQNDYDAHPGEWNMPYASTINLTTLTDIGRGGVSTSGTKVEFYVDETGWTLQEYSGDLILTRPTPPAETPDNRPDLWNPRIVPARPMMILFDRSREDMSSMTDIHLAALPFVDPPEGSPLTMSEQYSRLMHISKGPDGTIHLLWRGKPGYTPGVFHGTLNPITGQINNVTRVSTGTRADQTGRVIATTGGEVHVFWLERLSNSNHLYDTGIYWTRWTGSGWQAEENIAPYTDYLPDRSDWDRRDFLRYYFDVDISGNGDIIVVWAEPIIYTENAVIRQLRYDGSWGTTTAIETTNVRGIELLTDSTGTLHMVYWLGSRFGEGRGNLLHRTSDNNGASWSVAEALDTSGNACCPRMAAGTGNVIYLVWERNVAGQVVPVLRIYEDGAWDTARELEVRPEAEAWYPTVDAVNGSLVVAWSSRSVDRVTIETMEVLEPIPPSVQSDTVESQLGAPVMVELKAVDDGLPNTPGVLTYIICSLPTHGLLDDPQAGPINTVPYTLANYSNQVVYTPDEGYFGSDEFTFKANDGGTAPDGGDSNIGTITIEGSNCTDITIGTGTSTWNYPMHTLYHDSRTQVIYLSSEIGMGGSITALGLDVATVPGQTMNNWTIRMKHTTMSTYTTASLDATGWTVVYEGNEPPGGTGWRTFEFSTPFDYNDTNNLLVDFSHNNDSYTTSGLCVCSTPGGTRGAYARSDSAYGDPLDWSGTSSPLVSGTDKVPNVRATICADGGSVPEPILVNVSLNNLWMYQGLPGQSNSDLTAGVSVTDDPMGNSSYSYEWEIVLAGDVTLAPVTVDGGGFSDGYWTFAARGCDEPGGLSDSGQVFTVRVIITGDDYGNTGQAEAEFGIALLGDTNNDGVVNVADRSITNAFWRTGSAGPYTLRDCDVNCDGVVNVADRSIANAIWRGTLGQNSVSSPCPLR